MKFTVADLLDQLPANEALPVAKLEKALGLTTKAEKDQLRIGVEGLTRLGVRNELLPDGIRIQGGEGFSGGRIDSHGDHRIAMSFTIASLRAAGEIQVDDVANVATSFPGFVEIARQAGLDVQAA